MKFQQKSTPEYIAPSIKQKSTPYTKWIEKKCNKYYHFHTSIKNYQRYKARYLTVLCTMILFILLLIFASLFIYETDTKKTNLSKDWHVIISAILLFLSFVNLIILLFFTIYSCNFFNKSLEKYLLSDEYAEMVKKNDSIRKISHLSSKKVKTLYKMNIITKDLLDVYKKKN